MAFSRPLGYGKFIQHFKSFRRFYSVDSLSTADLKEKNNNVNTEEIDSSENVKKNTDHIYRKQMTKSEVTQHLLENVIYNEAGIIVTNKPYGVGKKSPSKMIKNFSPMTFTNVFMEEIVPDIAKEFGYSNLNILKSPERYSSGVLVLATDDKKETCTIFHKSNKPLEDVRYRKYLTVTLGNLKDKYLKTTFYLKKNMQQIKVFERCSERELKNFTAKRYHWEHKVLSETKLCSLVTVNLNNNHWNALKFYTASKCFSPILGDMSFGEKVKDIFGVPFYVKDGTDKLKLNPEVCSALKISEEEIQIIPSHVHLLSVSIPLDKNTKLSISVAPPESFIWTCEQLDLTLDDSLRKTKVEVLPRLEEKIKEKSFF